VECILKYKGELSPLWKNPESSEKWQFIVILKQNSGFDHVQCEPILTRSNGQILNFAEESLF